MNIFQFLQSFLHEHILIPEVGVFLLMLILFVIIRYVLRGSMIKKEHKAQSNIFQEVYFYSFISIVFGLRIFSSVFEIHILEQITTFSLAMLILYLITLVIHSKILVIYGEEIEVSGQKYFKKGYKVSLFSIFVNLFSFLIGVFLCIQIFELDSIVEIGGLWAGILAFMGFTAPVWALDMIAGIILLQSKNYEIGNVFYVYDLDTYVWLKSISLTEVKLIDLKTVNPIILRPSKFRDLSVKNLSLGIVAKNARVMQEIKFTLDYAVKQEDITQMLYEAFDVLQADLLDPKKTSFFGENPHRELVIQKFGDYGVEYSFFYTIESPFYIHKARSELYEKFLQYQQRYQVFFATPDLISLRENTSSTV